MAKQALITPDKDRVNLERVKKKAHMHHTPEGSEVPDPVPIAPPVGYVRTKPIREQLREMVQSEALARAARDSGNETFEEAEDFDVGDDIDPRSPWEEQFEPMPSRTDTMADVVERGFSAALSKHTAAGGSLTDFAPPARSSNAEPPAGNEASRLERGDPPPEATKQRSQTPLTKNKPHSAT